ncbi:MAG TPA: GH92 family glycosyl hydrolase [Kofleriaceae bacterium]|nr:GH92 family glycosyl hydrolase [Kofleriaceae bacterium]
MRLPASAVVLALACACGGDDAPPPIAPEVTDPVAYVDPRIGTGGLGFAHGSCFVGAVAPHGLVKAGPDTSGPFGTVSFQHYSGYWGGDDKIRGFSQVHMHGTGATDYGVLSLMPVAAFDPGKTSVVDYETKFAKDAEHAAAGRYEVTLDNGIAVTLAATQRVAVHRYTNAGAVVIDLAKTLDGGVIDAASISIASDEITGELHHIGGMSGGFGGYTIHFVMRSSVPWTSAQTWSAGVAPSSAPSATGTGVGAALVIPADFQIAIGLSLVSLDGARANLAAEVPAVDVEAVAATTRQAWARTLGTVLVTGGSEDERTIFYTSLYHAFLMPSVIGDVDGTYQLVGQPPQLAAGWHQMSDLSLWDTYRTVQPLYAWLVPDSAHDAARSLVAFGDALGIYPIWPVAIGESGTMLGSSAEIVIADAVLRGVPDVGAELAWPRMRAIAMDPVAPATGRGPRNHVEEYMTLGYVPASVRRSVSLTTEFAHDDFALGQLAGALGQTADRDALLARAHGWRDLLDPGVGFLRGRNADGTFPTTTFDPLELSDDYAEANAWHSLWMAGAHDPDGLAEILGGRDAAVAKLEMFFELAKQDWDTSDASAANFPRPYYWHGNEPDMNAAFLFAQLGRPDLTQQWARWVEDTMYTPEIDGIPGNDDGGTMGAWYVLAALGVYPIPGSDQWILDAPRFPQARIVVAGHELAIVAHGSGTHVASIALDGVPVPGPTITHAQLAGASELVFEMTP